MNLLEKIAEQKIKEAQERGDFTALPGRGEPLALEDDRGVPEELRLAYKILRNANCLPPELEAVREIKQVEDMLAGLTDEREKYKALKRIQYLMMKAGELRHRPVSLEIDPRYYAGVVERLEGNKRQSPPED